jgi:hypothetical protein
MTETKHTPTPWRVSPTGMSVWSGDQDADSFTRICIRPEGKVSAKENEEWPANAAFIVRACNAHDDLVSALQKWAVFMHENYTPEELTWFHETDAALAKAKANDNGSQIKKGGLDVQTQ